MELTELAKDRKFTVCIVITFISIVFIVFSVGYYFLFQDLTQSRAQFSLMICTNGTVSDFYFNTYIGNFTISDVESISNDKYDVIARGLPDYDDYSSLSVDFYKIDSKEPILVTFSYFRNITNLAFDASAIFFHFYPHLNIQRASPNITMITIYFAAFVRNRLGMEMVFASNSYTGNVKGSVVDELPFPHHKSWFLTTAIVFLAFCSISVALITINLFFRFTLKKNNNSLNSKNLRVMHIISKNTPWITLAMSIIMLAIYLFIGTGMDFIMLNYWNSISRWVEAFFSFLFHSSYDHLIGNLLVFIFSGTALEIWLKKPRFRFFWYFLPIPLNLFVDMLVFFSSEYPPVGASFWIIGQSIILGYYAYLNRDVFNLKSLKDFVFLLIAGYCLLHSTYDYLVSLIVYHLEKTTMILACGHIFLQHALF
jgi:hypothetical protein